METWQSRVHICLRITDIVETRWYCAAVVRVPCLGGQLQPHSETLQLLSMGAVGILRSCRATLTVFFPGPLSAAPTKLASSSVPSLKQHVLDIIIYFSPVPVHDLWFSLNAYPPAIRDRLGYI